MILKGIIEIHTIHDRHIFSKLSNYDDKLSWAVYNVLNSRYIAGLRDSTNLLTTALYWQDCLNKAYLRELIISKTIEILESIEIDAQLKQKLIEYLAIHNKIEGDFYDQHVKELYSRYDNGKSRINSLNNELLCSSSFDMNNYVRLLEEYKESSSQILEEIINAKKGDDEFAQSLYELFTIIDNPHNYAKNFRNLTYKKQHRIIDLVFGEIEIKDYTLDYKLSPLFNLLMKTDYKSNDKNIVEINHPLNNNN